MPVEDKAKNTRGTGEPPWLESVEVSGFQGDRKFGFSLSSTANFLIGKNGSGKTTLINLINAGLNGDIESLLSARFDTLHLTLTAGSENSRYTLKYKKSKSDISRSGSLEFTLLGPRGGRAANHTFYHHERFRYRDMPGRYVNEEPSSPLPFIFDREKKTPPNTAWLSILRSEIARPTNLEMANRNPIDRKIDELTTRISRYLSSLDTRAAERSAEFQKNYFLSLIGYSGSDLWSRLSQNFNQLNLNVEEDNLGKILSHLKLKPADYQEKLKKHFDAARSVSGKTGALMFDDAVTMIDTFRIHELNEKWITFEQDREAIYKPKRKFIEIINRLITAKRGEFNDRNQLIFDLGRTNKLEVPSLSSGEKQLFIILSEALVQEGRRAIYLADEPELSLHVEWQQYLVDNILDLNENCQVIFATHSPDIVGKFGGSTIDVEKL